MLRGYALFWLVLMGIGVPIRLHYIRKNDYPREILIKTRSEELNYALFNACLLIWGVLAVKYG